MTAAPVGFQCPDCVRQAQDQVAETRTTSALATSAVTPYVTWTLIGLCVAAYLAEMALGVDALAANWGMQPLAIAWEGQWYRLITPVFLHASLLHLGFNMYILFVIGQPLERLFGHVRFLVLFLISGLGGAVASYAFSDPQTLSVGASGAIFGLMGALVVAGRSMQFDVRQVGVLILINIVIGFVPGWNIDWRAHLGGLVVGAATSWVLLRSVRTGGQAVPAGRGSVSAASLAGLAAGAVRARRTRRAVTVAEARIRDLEGLQAELAEARRQDVAQSKA